MSLLDKFYEATNSKFRPFSKWWCGRDIWYEQISSRIWPRQKWLLKKIPRTWVDKDSLLEIVVLECLKYYVDKDGEDCFNNINTEADGQKEFYQEVRKYYDLITVKLVALQQELDAAWDAVPHRSLSDINKSQPGDYDRIYGEVNRLEKEISDLKTEIMVWVVKNREGLWT